MEEDRSTPGNAAIEPGRDPAEPLPALPDSESLLQFAPDAIVGVAPDGQIRFANLQAEALFGYESGGLIGVDVEELVPEGLRGTHREHRARYFELPGTRPMAIGLDLHAVRKNGTEFPCEISLSAVHLEGGTIALASIREIDPDKERDRTGLEEGIERVREVIDSQRITPVFQPIVELSGGGVAGYEALSRFEDEPERGPLHWFSLAQEVGLGPRLEVAAIRIALAEFAANKPPAGAEAPFVAVNASPAALALPHMPDLLSSPVAPDRIVVEVTEHAAIGDYNQFDADTAWLWRHDVRLAVDDVGAGYASLRHLLSLDPDFVKLDLSLTRGIEHDRRRRTIASGLIAFAREADCRVIAEGIETSGERDALLELGVQLGQGYAIGRPGPLP